MIQRVRAAVRDELGMTALEVVISLMILATVLLGIAATTSTAARSLVSGRLDSENVAAIQYQAERLMSVDYDSLTTGSALVMGVECEWSVTGTDMKRVALVAKVTNGMGDTVKDTTLLVRLDPDR